MALAEGAGGRPDAASRRTFATDLDDLLGRTTRRVRELWDAEHCSVWLRDPGRPHVHVSMDATAERHTRAGHALLPRARHALRVPVRAQTGLVGVVEVVGPRLGHFCVEDGARLEACAHDLGDAYDQLSLRKRDATWRLLPILAGVVLMAMGLLLVLGAAFALGARALPLSGLPARAGFWQGSVLTVLGLVLTGARRQRTAV